MPIYCVLGGTGSSGSAVVRALLANPPQDLTLRVYARSQKKLLGIFPDLAAKAEIVDGSLSDSAIAKRCFQDVDYIISCVASNYSEPGTTIAVDTAASIISTLQTLRAENPKTYHAPTVVSISSASMNGNLQPKTPAFAKKLLWSALHYIYTDVQAHEELYQTTLAADPDLLYPIFAQPPMIVPGDIPTGHGLSTTDQGQMLYFADLGVAMVELAGKNQEYSGKGVSIVATGKVVPEYKQNVKHLLYGACTYLFPGVWRVGRNWGWW